MGRRGPLPKDPAQLHGHRAKPEKKEPVVVQPVFVAPDPNTMWSEATKAAWAVYWESELASAALQVDLPGIRRLFSMYDQYERTMDVVGRALVVKGSTGQIRTNPLADHALKLDAAILRMENELGLTPAGRQRMGIQIRRPYMQPAAAPATTESRYSHLRVAK